MTITATHGPALYDELQTAARGLFEGERDFIANAANLSALIYNHLPDLNWCGFYLMRDGELVVGPFQGQVACVRIGIGKGVCGTAAQRRETVIVPDVHAFPGHIACDVRSRSEIVVPLIKVESVLGVLDLDSPSLARFSEEDAAGLEALVAIFLEGSDPQY